MGRFNDYPKGVGARAPKRRETMKVCGSCKTSKSLTEFSVQIKSLDGLQHKCKVCAAIDKRFRRYGVTEEWYNQKIVDQENSCGACGISKESYTRSRFFDVDHCHETGRPRGLLCNRCNMVLGQVNDDTKILKGITRYLRRFKI